MGSQFTNYSAIRAHSVIRDICVCYEGDGVGSFNAIAHSLSQSAQFIGEGLDPDPFVLRILDEVPVFHFFSSFGVEHRVGLVNECCQSTVAPGLGGEVDIVVGQM